ncbi:MAG TPA: hypothetical protein DEP51_06725 [Clostridiales bacterium]|nr:hypothetical protein [Clostridiales bacterium]
MKKNLKIFLLIIIILIYMFSNQEVYSFKDKVLYDAKSRPHTETVPEAGDVIEVPAEVDQTGADCAGTGIIRGYIKEKWDGSKDENGWCYLNVAGVNRYMVALAPLYGEDGDFVDIYITNNGVSTVYPCIIVDSKDVWQAFENEYPYEYNGKKYGHLSNESGKCKIVEIILDPYVIPQDLVNSLSGVTKIVNGGNIQEHPDGPVGLDGNYGSSSSNSNGSVSFSKKLGQLCRRGWIAVVTLFENDSTGNNASTVMITL